MRRRQGREERAPPVAFPNNGAAGRSEDGKSWAAAPARKKVANAVGQLAGGGVRRAMTWQRGIAIPARVEAQKGRGLH